MRLESVYYDMPGRSEFRRMARVLAFTAAQHCRDWQIRIEAIPAATPGTGTGVPQHVANTHKLAVWCDRVAAAEDGARLLLLDTDTFLTRPIDEIWQRPFDLAYATKRRPYPFNLGVLFIRVSPATRAFFEAWRTENDALFAPADPPVMRAWRAQYGGINQAAFGMLQARGRLHGLQVAELSCREWNCEDSAWTKFDPSVTRIVHVKAALRRQIFGRDGISIDLAPLVERWRALERESEQYARAVLT